jgi:hypothetical protein
MRDAVLMAIGAVIGFAIHGMWTTFKIGMIFNRVNATQSYDMKSSDVKLAQLEILSELL